MGRTANFNDKERYLIHVDLAHGLKPCMIAKKLYRHPSCSYKEIKFNY